MRMVVKLSVAFFAVALVASASVSAQTVQKKSDEKKSPAATMQATPKQPDGVKAPGAKVLTPTAPARPKPNTSTMAPKGNRVPLTSADCTDLGGTVQTNNLCNSKSACSRTDQNGKTYHVCISSK